MASTAGWGRLANMTRETKLGIVVSCSFLCLLGVVLGLKLFGDGGAADAQAAREQKTEADQNAGGGESSGSPPGNEIASDSGKEPERGPKSGRGPEPTNENLNLKEPPVQQVKHNEKLPASDKLPQGEQKENSADAGRPTIPGWTPSTSAPTGGDSAAKGGESGSGLPPIVDSKSAAEGKVPAKTVATATADDRPLLPPLPGGGESVKPKVDDPPPLPPPVVTSTTGSGGGSALPLRPPAIADTNVRKDGGAEGDKAQPAQTRSGSGDGFTPPPPLPSAGATPPTGGATGSLPPAPVSMDLKKDGAAHGEKVPPVPPVPKGADTPPPLPPVGDAGTITSAGNTASNLPPPLAPVEKLPPAGAKSDGAADGKPEPIASPEVTGPAVPPAVKPLPPVKPVTTVTDTTSPTGGSIGTAPAANLGTPREPAVSGADRLRPMAPPTDSRRDAEAGTGASAAPSPPPEPSPAPVVRVSPIGTPAAVSVPPVKVPPPGMAGPAVTLLEPRVVSFTEEMYSCAPGDTFERISAQKYGTDRYAEALRLFNRSHPVAGDDLQEGGALRPGQRLFIPPAEVLDSRYPASIRSAAPTQGSAAPVAAGKYRVEGNGETMRQIAKKLWGDPERWKDIYLNNPNLRPEYPVPGGTILKVADAAPGR